jgi:hypothetical protein
VLGIARGQDDVVDEIEAGEAADFGGIRVGGESGEVVETAGVDGAACAQGGGLAGEVEAVGAFIEEDEALAGSVVPVGAVVGAFVGNGAAVVGSEWRENLSLTVAEKWTPGAATA